MLSAVDDWGPGTVTLRERKTGKLRTVGLSTEAARALGDLRRRTERARRRDGSRWLLPTLRGRNGDTHEHRCTIWRHWRSRCRELGLPDSYTLHSLRKVYAVRLYKRTRSLARVQADLNHDRPLTTLIYLADALLTNLKY